MADIRRKTPKEVIAKALEGNREEDLMFVLWQNYDTFKHFCVQLDRCDTELEKRMENYHTEVAEAGRPSYSPTKNVVTTTNENEPWASMWKESPYDMWGVNVFEIPGISLLTALELMSESGHDFTWKFPASKQFCSWCNIATEHQDIRRKKDIKARTTSSKQCRIDFP